MIHQQVIDHLKAKTIMMMLKDLAAFYGIDKASIKEIFKIKIQIKRNINLSYISDKMREKLCLYNFVCIYLSFYIFIFYTT